LPINKSNYLTYLRQKYGPFATDSAFYLGKYLLKIGKIRHDLHFLKTCKKENLFPTFVRFRIPPSHQRYKSALFNCYRDILIKEIKIKKRELSRLYRLSHRLRSDLLSNLDHISFVRTTSIIQSLVKQHEHQWISTHDKKLDQLRSQQRPPITRTTTFEYPKKPVHNFSKRKLTDEEMEALSKGLDFVFPSTKTDDETLIANVESLFVSLLGYATDRRDYETKQEDERTQYKLTPEQLQFANKIRHVTDQYRHQASNTLKNIDRSHVKSLNLLKELSKDKSIVITKADKGHSVVILDRDEYLRKMESLISDRTKFEPIDHDPTIAEEDRLTRKLRCLKERRFITEQEYDLCFPSGSQPGTLYGLPKVHKVGVPLRPILSATGTFNYGIARLLVNRLSHLKKHPTKIQHTFSFVDGLHSLQLDMSEHRLISFDVVNLFTNVPLKDTIQIVLNELYPGKCQCESAT
jgi:hypothetical protein